MRFLDLSDHSIADQFYKITWDINNDKYEIYNFMLKNWFTPKEFYESKSIDIAVFFSIYPYPYKIDDRIVKFKEAMENQVKDLPTDTDIYFYESNESFVAMRAKNET